MSGQPVILSPMHCEFNSTSQRLLWFGLVLSLIFGPTKLGFGQSKLPNYPPPEYYVSYELLKNGLMEKADEGFRTALRPLNIEIEARRIDSVPALTMRGECLYHMGRIAEALEQYDAALMVSIQAADWIRTVQHPTAVVEKVDPATRSIQWAASQRNLKVGAISRKWQVSVGASGRLIQIPNADTLQPGVILTVDAMEILRCQAIAARRRFQILGPLAAESPITERYRQSLALNFGAIPPSLQHALNVCQVVAALDSDKWPRQIKTLEDNLTVQGGLDHPLTPIALLTLADLSMRQSRPIDAQKFLIEATLSAAHQEQLDVVSEAIQTTTMIASQYRDPNLAGVLESMFGWSRNRCLMIAASCLLASSELEVTLEKADRAEATLRQLTNLLSPRDVQLTKMEAMGHWAAAKMHWLQGNVPSGIESMDRALKLIRGDDQLGTASKQLFRLRLVERLYRDGTWTAEQTRKYLTMLIDNPPRVQWQLEPLESMAALVCEKGDSLETLLDLELRRGDASSVAAVVDLAQRYHFQTTTAMGGRLLALRRIFMAEPRTMSDLEKNDAITWRKAFPGLAKASTEYLSLVESLAASPVKADIKKWDDATRKPWESLAAASANMERLLRLAAVSSDSVSLNFPNPLDIGSLQEKLGEENVVLCFFPSGGNYYGLAIDGKSVEQWKIGPVADVEKQIGDALQAIGVAKQRASIDELMKGSESPIFTEIQQSWLPKELEDRWVETQQMTIVPVGPVWYLPFELLPFGESPTAKPWMERFRISYSPTLGQVARNFERTPSVRRTLGITHPGFWGGDTATERAWVDELIASEKGTEDVAVGAAPGRLQPSRWMRIHAGRAWVAGYQPLLDASTFAPFGFDSAMEDSLLNSWLLSPIASPQEVILPGIETIVTQGKLGTGREIFELACTAQASGVRSLLMSRWPVRGHSTSKLLQGYVENLSKQSASSSWQRSVLALWEETLESKNEPSLLPISDRPPIVPGRLPWLWSGYMQIGDTQPGPAIP